MDGTRAQTEQLAAVSVASLEEQTERLRAMRTTVRGAGRSECSEDVEW